MVKYGKKSFNCNVVIDDRIDLSPSRNGSILKRILQKGNYATGLPRKRDALEINWKVYHENGTMLHSSSNLSYTFDFMIGVEPRQVILGWEISLYTMYEGEVAELLIQPEYGFKNGAPDIIPSNIAIKTELELVKIKPHFSRMYKSVGYNESIKDELVANMEKGYSPMVDEVLSDDEFTKDEVISPSAEVDRITNLNSEHKKIYEDTEVTPQQQEQQQSPSGRSTKKFFDPATMKEDPNQQVMGTSVGHFWIETPTTMEVNIPVPETVTKQDIIISLSPNTLNVTLKSGEVLLYGPLQGRIIPSECVWAILPRDIYSTTEYKGPKIQLSLEKSHGYKQIWASVLSRTFLNTNVTDKH